MSSPVLLQTNSDTHFKRKGIFLLFLTLLLSAVFIYFLSHEHGRLSALIFLLPFVAFVFFEFHRYFAYVFVYSLFVDMYLYWPLRIQTCFVISIAIIFYFVVNSESSLFNSFRLPKSIKISSLFIVIAVFLSEIFSPFVSAQTVYFGFLFFVFMCTSYVIFRAVKSSEAAIGLLDAFAIGVALSAVIALGQILISSKLRSLGIAGYAIMDFSAMAFLYMLFMYLILGKGRAGKLILMFLILSVLITTQSRFAWLGFALSFIYGMVISAKFGTGVKDFLKSRLFVIVAISLFIIAFLFVTGLSRIITSRFTEVSFNFLEVNDEGGFINNSLDTRIMIWAVAVSTFLHNPITGVGYQMFLVVSEKYNILPDYLYVSYVKDMDAHTTYMNFLAETGIVGLTSFLLYLSTVFVLSFKAIKKALSSSERNVSITLNILIFFIIVHSIYSGAFTFGQNGFHMHLIIGIAIANYVYLDRRVSSQ